MTVNATFVVQVVHFIVAYLLLRILIFTPVLKRLRVHTQLLTHHKRHADAARATVQVLEKRMQEQQQQTRELLAKDYPALEAHRQQRSVAPRPPVSSPPVASQEALDHLAGDIFQRLKAKISS
jgi:uncharacterized protein YPO0396